jgi:hypothetical protein
MEAETTCLVEGFGLDFVQEGIHCGGLGAETEVSLLHGRLGTTRDN